MSDSNLVAVYTEYARLLCYARVSMQSLGLARPLTPEQMQSLHCAQSMQAAANLLLELAPTTAAPNLDCIKRIMEIDTEITDSTSTRTRCGDRFVSVCVTPRPARGNSRRFLRLNWQRKLFAVFPGSFQNLAARTHAPSRGSPQRQSHAREGRRHVGSLSDWSIDCGASRSGRFASANQRRWLFPKLVELTSTAGFRQRESATPGQPITSDDRVGA